MLVYSGMGSQWPGMGADLMRIPVFAETIDRLHATLSERGLDLKRIITNESPDAFDDIMNSFVGITAIQVWSSRRAKHMMDIVENKTKTLKKLKTFESALLIRCAKR